MNSCLHQLMDTVNAAGLNRPEDFVEDGFALFATAIAKLSPEKRERLLLEVECGALRQAVSQFERPFYPRANGSGKGGLQ
jgi:hypothetical protein